MDIRHYLPLVGFVVPTVIIGYGFGFREAAIAGVNELTIGFASSIVGACVTYVLGVRSCLKARQCATAP